MGPLQGSRVKIRGHMIAHRIPLNPRTSGYDLDLRRSVRHKSVIYWNSRTNRAGFFAWELHSTYPTLFYKEIWVPLKGICVINLARKSGRSKRDKLDLRRSTKSTIPPSSDARPLQFIAQIVKLCLHYKTSPSCGFISDRCRCTFHTKMTQLLSTHARASSDYTPNSNNGRLQSGMLEVCKWKVVAGNVSFIRHFKKICGPHKHQTCNGNTWKYGTELLETNYPVSFHRGPDTWMVTFCCNHRSR